MKGYCRVRISFRSPTTNTLPICLPESANSLAEIFPAHPRTLMRTFCTAKPHTYRAPPRNQTKAKETKHNPETNTETNQKPERNQSGWEGGLTQFPFLSPSPADLTPYYTCGAVHASTGLVVSGRSGPFGRRPADRGGRWCDRAPAAAHAPRSLHDFLRRVR